MASRAVFQRQKGKKKSKIGDNVATGAFFHMFWIHCVDIVISRWTEFSGDGLCYAELGQVVGRRRRELFFVGKVGKILSVALSVSVVS